MVALLLWVGCPCSLLAQSITLKDLQPFISEGYRLEDSSGPGLGALNGDILLVLKTKESYGGRALVLLRRENGHLKKLASNDQLMLSEDELGVSGGAYASLTDGALSVNCSVGSGSDYESFSYGFQKGADGRYLFNDYKEQSFRYGEEDLFARIQLSAVGSFRPLFAKASLADISAWAQAARPSLWEDPRDNPLLSRLRDFLADGVEPLAIGVGDLNKDALGKDLVLVAAEKGTAPMIKILLEQKGGSYKEVASNEGFLEPSLSPLNYRVVVKNGFFTIEHRLAVENGDYVHLYLSFAYDERGQLLKFHRLDVETYQGFKTKPKSSVLLRSGKNEGLVLFEQLKHLPGLYLYAPNKSELKGRLVEQKYFGPPSYGEHPEKDQQLSAYVLVLDVPIGVLGEANKEGQSLEQVDHTLIGVKQIQLLYMGQNLNLKDFLHKHIAVHGLLESPDSAHHITDVLLEVDKVRVLE